MRHVVWLGIRGVLLELSGLMLRAYGAWCYRRLLRRSERRLQAQWQLVRQPD